MFRMGLTQIGETPYCICTVFYFFAGMEPVRHNTCVRRRQTLFEDIVFIKKHPVQKIVPGLDLLEEFLQIKIALNPGLRNFHFVERSAKNFPISVYA